MERAAKAVAELEASRDPTDVEAARTLGDSPRGSVTDPAYYDINKYPGTAAAHFQMTPAFDGTQVTEDKWNSKKIGAMMFTRAEPYTHWNMNYLLHPSEAEHTFWDSHIAIGFHRPGGAERDPRNRPKCPGIGEGRDPRMLQQDPVVCLPCLIPVGKDPNMPERWKSGNEQSCWYVESNAYFCLICLKNPSKCLNVPLKFPYY